MKLFALRFCSTRIFALGREDRSFYLLSSAPLFFPVCIAREPVGHPDRKHGPWTSPSFFLLSREAARGGSPLRAIAPSFVLFISVALSLSCFFLFSACLCSFFSRFYPSSLPLCFLSRLFSSFISVSRIGILFLQLLLRPFTIHLCYVTDTFIQGVPLSSKMLHFTGNKLFYD